MKAVEEGSKVDPLTWNPTAGDWTMHVPCDAENIDWVKESLAKTSPRIKVFDVEEADRADEDGRSPRRKADGNSRRGLEFRRITIMATHAYRLHADLFPNS